MKGSLRFKILIVWIFSSYWLYGQYIQFSQFYSVPTVLSPSFTGLTKSERVNIVYRDQWAKLKGVYKTEALGFDMNIRKFNSGLGLLIVNDVAGQGNLRRTDFGVLYSWYGLVSKSYNIYIRPGIQFKLSQRAIDLQNLIFPSHIKPDGSLVVNPIYPQPADIQKLNVDATASFLVYSDYFWSGVTVDHLFRPASGFYDPTYKTPLKYSVYGGYRWQLKNRRVRRYSNEEDWFFAAFHYRLMAGSDQMDIGAYWDHAPIILGLWVRGLPYLNMDNNKTVDALIFILGYKVSFIKIGYSYDLPVNSLLTRIGGTHEISITIEFETFVRKRKDTGPLPCPKL